MPFVLLSLLDSRTSYLYYMVIVMPGIYIAVGAIRRTDQAADALDRAVGRALAIAVVVMYPFTPLP